MAPPDGKDVSPWKCLYSWGLGGDSRWSACCLAVGPEVHSAKCAFLLSRGGGRLCRVVWVRRFRYGPVRDDRDDPDDGEGQPVHRREIAARDVFPRSTPTRATRPTARGPRSLFAAGATTRTCDLKKLQTAQDVLGTGPLATGHYTMVRLVVSSAAIYFDNAATGDACAATIAAPAGRNANVTIPSGEVEAQSRVRRRRARRPRCCSTSTVTSRFAETGNGQFMMSPVIGVVSVSNDHFPEVVVRPVYLSPAGWG